VPEYLAPGVYIEEQNNINTIEGVSTSIAGFVGMTRRGRLVGLPQLVTSFNEFSRLYGGFVDFGFGAGFNYLPYAVDGFFANGGEQLFVMRVMKSATAATATATGGLVTRLQAGADAAVGQNKIHPLTLRGMTAAVPTKIRLRMVKNGITYESSDFTVASIDASTGEVTLSGNLDVTPTGPVTFEASSTTVLTDVNTISLDAAPPNRVIGLPTSLASVTSARTNTFTITAADEGNWGKDIVVTATATDGARSEALAAGNGGADDNVLIKLKSAAGFYTNAWVEIDRGNEKRYRKVKSVSTGDNSIVVFGDALINNDFLPQIVGVPTVVTVAEFRLSASFDGVTETYAGLTLENVPGRYYADRVNNGSDLITVSAPAGTTDPFSFPSGPDGQQIALGGAGNLDGVAPVASDFIGGGAPGSRTGLKAMEDIREISILAAPGLVDVAVQGALIEQCERLKDRFAILDPAPHGGNTTPTITDIQNQRGQFDTKYAAIYYPRLIMTNPLTNLDEAVPPSGHMTGIYARVDVERGVHKAPANEIVRDILRFETTVNKETQEILNPSPKNINVFRDFRADGRGLRIWGARCITSLTEWKYINVRRLFIFLEESLDQGTQWVVFEPNDERLWARVRQTITLFLTRVWRDGALMGTRAEEAFFVKCDRSTMTQDDLDNGRLIVLVGVAPVKPAEFVIIRIGQWTASAQNQV
jgi:phage tail sheath protein FI